MQRGVYSAATAMSSAQQWLDVVTHNLANASTAGYKRDVVGFDEGLLRAMRAQAGQGVAVGDLGSGAVQRSYQTDFSQGNLTPTGNQLDVAIKGPVGAFAVQTPAGVRYTHNGSFTLDVNRRLTDQQGHPVLGSNNQPITLPQGKPEIDPDGSVKVDGRPAGRIGVFAGDFQKVGAGFFDAANPQPMAQVEVIPRTLESSNVNAIEEMVAMIRINRGFEVAQKSIQSQDESTQRLIQGLQGR